MNTELIGTNIILLLVLFERSCHIRHYWHLSTLTLGWVSCLLFKGTGKDT